MDQDVYVDAVILRQEILAGRIGYCTEPSSYDHLCVRCKSSDNFMFHAEHEMTRLASLYVTSDDIGKRVIHAFFKSLAEVMLVVDEDAADGFRNAMRGLLKKEGLIDDSTDKMYCMDIPGYIERLEALGWKSLEAQNGPERYQ